MCCQKDSALKLELLRLLPAVVVVVTASAVVSSLISKLLSMTIVLEEVIFGDHFDGRQNRTEKESNQ